MLKAAAIALSLATLTGCGTITTRFLERDCRPDPVLMSPNEVPDPPPIVLDVEALKYYVRYQWVLIELRDQKHARLVSHVEAFCQP